MTATGSATTALNPNNGMADLITGTAGKSGAASDMVQASGISSVFSADWADALSADSGNFSGSRAAVMTDVANAITKAVSDGGSVDDMYADATSSLSAGSSFPRRAVAYLSGLVNGATLTNSQEHTAVGGAVPGGSLGTAYLAGQKEAMSISNLASAIAGGGSSSSDTTTFVPPDARTAAALVSPATRDHVSMAA